jgi:sec-independent protein translocase protein TatA
MEATGARSLKGDGDRRMGLSWWHILLVLLVFVLLFGTGKISGLMGDLAKGIKSFKKEMTEEGAEAEAEAEPEPAAKAIEHKPAKSAAKPKTASRAKSPRAPKAG